MKASCAHVALASVLTACTGSVALAFVPPAVRVPHGGSQARHALGSTSQGSATMAAFKGGVARGAIAPREGVRLAAREDCKSCMEKDLLQAEAAAGRGVEEDDREDRRALFEEENRREKSRNIKIAFGSFLSAVGLFFFQHSVIAPAQANPVILLRAMETSSAPLATALTNGKPTVVDFYADWCENCKVMAPSMREIEEQFKNQINFVVVDGSAEKNFDLVDAFRVDGIPHLAMVNANGEVETAIIGTVPKNVVVDDIKALLADRPLPYQGFDMFEGEDHNIKGHVAIQG
eukprot:jgi/Undpi1/2635/HiC_scaffold_13.g06014.m1